MPCKSATGSQLLGAGLWLREGGRGCFAGRLKAELPGWDSAKRGLVALRVEWWKQAPLHPPALTLCFPCGGDVFSLPVCTLSHVHTDIHTHGHTQADCVLYHGLAWGGDHPWVAQK